MQTKSFVFLLITFNKFCESFPLRVYNLSTSSSQAIYLIKELKESFSAYRDDSNNDFDQTKKGAYDETWHTQKKLGMSLASVKESCQPDWMIPMENGSSEGQLGLDKTVKWRIGQADDGTEMLFSDRLMGAAGQPPIHLLLLWCFHSHCKKKESSLGLLNFWLHYWWDAVKV